MCKFLVYTTVDMKVIYVPADADFQNKIRTPLVDFFQQSFKPAYLDLHFFKCYSKYSFDKQRS